MEQHCVTCRYEDGKRETSFPNPKQINELSGLCLIKNEALRQHSKGVFFKFTQDPELQK